MRPLPAAVPRPAPSTHPRTNTHTHTHAHRHTRPLARLSLVARSPSHPPRAGHARQQWRDTSPDAAAVAPTASLASGNTARRAVHCSSCVALATVSCCGSLMCAGAFSTRLDGSASPSRSTTSPSGWAAAIARKCACLVNPSGLASRPSVCHDAALDCASATEASSSRTNCGPRRLPKFLHCTTINAEIDQSRTPRSIQS